MAHVNRRIGKSSETAVSTADGTGGGVLDAFLHDYFNRSGNLVTVPGAPPPAGITATGGVVYDYAVSGTYYRSHTFNTSGAFTVNALAQQDPDLPNTIDYVIVAGGGGGAGGSPGNYTAGGVGGGGAGQFLTASDQPISAQAYPVAIAAGGAGGSRSAPAGSAWGRRSRSHRPCAAWARRRGRG